MANSDKDVPMDLTRLGMKCRAIVFGSCPRVLDFRELCEVEGCDFQWIPGETHQLIQPGGTIHNLFVIEYQPFLEE